MEPRKCEVIVYGREPITGLYYGAYSVVNDEVRSGGTVVRKTQIVGLVEDCNGKLQVYPISHIRLLKGGYIDEH